MVIQWLHKGYKNKEENQMKIILREGEQVCANCMYFIQHYIPGGYPFPPEHQAINCGHCTHMRLKHRSPYAEACSHWQAKNKIILR